MQAGPFRFLSVQSIGRRRVSCYNVTMLRLRALVVSPFFAFLLLPVAAHAQEADVKGTLSPKGPLPYRNSEPLTTPFLAPAATDARVLQRGKSRVDFNIDIVNNLLTLTTEPPKKYVLDFEEQRASLGLARGLGNGQEIGVRLLYVSRNGGILDGFINNWHKAFGFKGGGRDTLPSRRTLYQINNADGLPIINETAGHGGLGDTVLEYRRALSKLPDSESGTRRVGIMARALIKLPTGNKTYLLGSGKADVGAGLAATVRPLRNLALHGNVSLTFTGKPNIKNFDTRRTFVHSLVSAEYLFDGRTSAVVQTDDSPAPFRSGFSYADRPRRAFTFGFWREIGRGKQIYLLNSENDFGAVAKSAPDFVLSFGTRFLVP